MNTKHFCNNPQLYQLKIERLKRQFQTFCDHIISSHPILNKWLGKDLQYVAISIGACKNNHYIINQNHIFSKKILWSHFWIDFKFYTKTFGIVIFWLFIYSLCCYDWFLFVHNLNTTNKNWLWFSYIFQLNINPKN